jgi:hypothetical protein
MMPGSKGKLGSISVEQIVAYLRQFAPGAKPGAAKGPAPPASGKAPAGAKSRR